MPVQRYKDSLRRRHFEDEPQTIPTRDTDKDDDLIPGNGKGMTNIILILVFTSS